MSRGAKGLIASGTVAIVVLGGVLVGIVRTPDQAPTLEEAHAAVEESLERVRATFPADAVVDAVSEVTEQPCPVEGGGVIVERHESFALDHALVIRAWDEEFAEAFPEADGWYVTAGQGSEDDSPLDLTIVGRDLSVVNVRVIVDGDATTVEMTTTSQCAPMPTTTPTPSGG